MIIKKSQRIGFDLDGVIINKPPIIPKSVIEWLVRSHANTDLSYRYPKRAFERWIRWLSHHPSLRPPMKQNIEVIRKLSNEKRYKLFVISSRYKFLDRRTKQWFTTKNLNGIFKGVYLNLDNEQPHLFKEKMIKKLKIDLFLDDDLPILRYLKKKIRILKVIHVSHRKHGLKGVSFK